MSSSINMNDDTHTTDSRTEAKPVYASAIIDSQYVSDSSLQQYPMAKIVGLEAAAAAAAAATGESSASVTEAVSSDDTPTVAALPEAEVWVIEEDNDDEEGEDSSLPAQQQQTTVGTIVVSPTVATATVVAGSSGSGVLRPLSVVAEDKNVLYPKLKSMKKKRKRRMVATGVVVGAAGVVVAGPILGALIGVYGALAMRSNMKRNEHRYKVRCDRERMQGQGRQQQTTRATVVGTAAVAATPATRV